MNDSRELYKVEGLPVFQNRVFHSPNDSKHCPKGDVVLVQDMQTGLIHNRAFKSELMQYDADYQNEQAVSSTFRVHLDEVAKIIGEHFRNDTLIEVGCGKGFFLEHLQSLSYEITGLDPTYEGSNPSIIKSYLTPAVGLRADGIILRHVLEHIQDPVAFLANIRESNAGGGKIYIEVPCFDWICRRRAWFDIFYEHVNYFRLNDFQRMFGRVYSCGRIFGGQYLYVVADLATLRKPVYDNLAPIQFPPDFLGTVSGYASRLRSEGGKERAKKQTVMWGCASKGVIFALFMQRAGASLDFVVDINPAKQGKYLAVTGLQVDSPERMMKQLDRPAEVFVMNSNYLTEIKKLTNHQFEYLTVDRETI